MSDKLRIPIIEEEARVTKRTAAIERVSVRTFPEEEHVVLRDEVRREHVDVTRIALDREVAEAPAIRTEGDVTIMPVLEERLVVEKRLFLVGEIHLRRTVHSDAVEIPAMLRRMGVEVDREEINQQEDH